MAYNYTYATADIATIAIDSAGAFLHQLVSFAPIIALGVLGVLALGVFARR